MNLDNGKRILKLYDYEFRATADLPNPAYKKGRYTQWNLLPQEKSLTMSFTLQ